ncbi:adenylosuccinate synthase [candidate division Kazan bacterium RIFCSPHIGHO2_01_FULL_49_10]|uniref:Adenylosuccinate synthetase n=1 Tax=candidate division Kazan bacterium RIFCSPLOWO2_01_FULL_48_13 TaxID=1798539 RepID=A0A1F4PPG5_UNCK3|nr:MAG: adenylosuccinate synthase [candidate division Kazan bacterium RIFCSPHIGHO2_01_FULL_49_10]OGB85548.1 MAG: adenylosuccinate synthase [candidate division Kazan bacterium RIFCSPLOWO2_01_FULL_48_13]
MSIQKPPLATIVVGAQWGDEGKGKLVHALSPRFSKVIRYQGGSNAGHTVKTDGQIFRFRLLPSGILYSHLMAILARGVVANPSTLATEISELRAQNAFRGQLLVDYGIHLVLQVHEEQDKHMEDAKTSSNSAVGTTRRGIGPAYADQCFRVGLRAGDLLLPQAELRQRFFEVVSRKNALFVGYYDGLPLDPEALWVELVRSIEVVAPYIGDAVSTVMTAKEKREPMLFEGAQGAMLDKLTGTYPFVTSSHPGVGGALLGTGLNYTDIVRVVGVTKAYCTRVGNGPFPTEETGSIGDLLCELGAEYGTNTGRKRRCGWLDLVLLNYVAELNGITEWAVTKVDVLDEMSEVLTCSSYSHPAEKSPVAYPEMDRLGEYQARYSRFGGWMSDTTGCRESSDLPEQLSNYIKHIEVVTKRPVRYVSVGADSDAIVDMRLVGANQAADAAE